MKKKSLRILCAALVSVVVLSACGTPKESTAGTTDASGAQGKESLNIAITAEPKTMDTLLADDFAAWNITNQIYDSLINLKTDGTLEPGLAEKWEYSADGTEITFTLRKGVKFHNGEELKADDVVFTYDKVIPYPPAQNLTSAMSAMTKVDDYTVKLKLKAPFGPAEYCVGGSQLSIVNKKAYEADPEGFSRNPVGTGAYKFVEWKNGDKIALTRFDEYYRGKPAIKDVTYKIITDASTSVVALEKGEIDLLDSVPAADRQNVMDNAKLGYVEAPQASATFISMNNKRGLLANEKLRQAISFAIDKESLILGAVNGIGSPLETPMVSGVFGWPEEFKNNEYNLEKAKQLMQEAGYPDGVDLVFTTMEGIGYTKPTEVLQDQLRQIGITVEIQKMERAKFLDVLLTQKAYDAAIMTASAFYPDADYIYALFHSDPTEKGRNYHLNEDPEVDRLLEAARGSTVPAEREKYYLELCEVFKEKAISIPLYQSMIGTGYAAGLKGVQPNTFRRMFVFDLSW